jgi:magnesium-transporting ATPase (P-type)
LQINDDYHEDEVNQILKATFNGVALPRPPVNRCCIGFILKTGFDTSKGKLIRRVVAHAENPSIEQKDGLWIILFLLICSIFTSAYVLDQGMDN